jgi:CBS domain-containing protein
MRTESRRPVLFASLLLGTPVFDRADEPVALVRDLIARLDLEARERYPSLTGFVARVGSREVFMPWTLVDRITQDGIWLDRAGVDLRRFERRTGEVLLFGDVLDKQLVDVHGRRVIRASDVMLAADNGHVRVVGVDVGFAAILRRAAPRSLGRQVARVEMIDWEDVEYLASGSPEVRLRGGHPKIARLHPVEIAALIDDLPDRLGAEIVESLDDAVAADVVEELSEERQADIVELLDQDRAADVLEEMEPDAAADVLADLSPETVTEILAELPPEDAADIRELLEHREGTAGSMMTTWFATIAPDLSAQDTLATIRALDDRPPFLHYLYVVEGHDDRLLGQVSMADIVCADPLTLVRDIMDDDPPRANAETSIDDVAARIAEYNLLALPIVDEVGRMLGIVTVDDVLAEMMPSTASRAISRIFG